MALITVLKNKTFLPAFGAAVVAALILFVNLGGFGMWEPQELAIAAEAEHIVDGRFDNRSFQRVEAALATIGWKLAGRSELGARLPTATMAFLSVLLVFFLLRRLGDLRIAVFGILFYLGSPLLIYHGRQLTEGMPPVVGEIAAMGGLSLLYFGQKQRLRVPAALLALFGLALGAISRGILVGGASPIMAVAAAILLSRSTPSEDRTANTGRNKGTLWGLILGSIAVLLAGGYVGTVLFSGSDIPLVTGGLNPVVNKKWAFAFSLEQIVYSWFPWIALIPITVVKFFTTDSGESESRTYLRALTITGLLFGYLSQVFSLEVAGLKPASTAFPIIIGIALAIDDIVQDKSPMRLFIVLSAALLALMIRDFAQNNQTLLYGYGFDKVEIPEKYYTHVVQAALFTVPFALLLIVGFLADSPIRRWLFRGLIPVAPLFFGAGIAFVMVPGLSVSLSSKHAVEVYEKFRKENEPLAVYGPGRFFSEAKKLRSTKDVVDWLGQSRRVFALFPPDKLFEFDHKMRAETGKHIYVLDAKSERFVVATSKPIAGEKNENPIAPFVQSKPFTQGPENSMSVNFDNVVTFMGWDLLSGKDNDRINKGKELVFTTYWHMDGRIPGDYKMFMHIDGPGGRLHGDHEPFEGRFPTSKWQKGDYIKEVYRLNVPVYQGSGKYTIRLGLYKDSGRLRIIDEPTAKENSLFVTSLMME